MSDYIWNQSEKMVKFWLSIYTLLSVYTILIYYILWHKHSDPPMLLTYLRFVENLNASRFTTKLEIKIREYNSL